MTPHRTWAWAAACTAAVALAQAPASPTPPNPADAKAAKPAPPKSPGAAINKPGVAAPQPMKGRVKEGLYQLVREHEITGVPGIPKTAQNGIEQRQQCLKREDIERGVQAGEGCAVKSVKESPAAVSIAMTCTDGSTTDLDMTFDAAGYTSDMRTSGTQDGKPFTTRFRSKAKYLGPCKQP